MTWQCNWKVWHWPWHVVTDEKYGDLFDYKSHFAGIGPLQFHWYSN